MAGYQPLDPNERLPRPQNGPTAVPNMGGVQTRPVAAPRPPAPPAVRNGTPGPAPQPAPQTGATATPGVGFNAAQNYFNTFSGADQAHIRGTWGGSNLMDEWFKNAVTAGAVNPDGTRKVAPVEAPSSGGGGGGGGAQAAAAAPAAAAAGGGVEDKISAYLEKLLSGSDIDAIKGQIFQSAEGRRAAGEAALNEDLAHRGMLRAGEGVRGRLDLRNEADANYTGGVTSALLQERAQKLPILQALQSQLGMNRDWQATQEQLAEQRASRAAASSAAARAEARAAAARQFIDPETGTQYELPEWMV
jgi:hypothetical protein